MTGAVSRHEFFAPVAGVAHRFSIFCRCGVPFEVYAVDNGEPPRPDPFVGRQLAELNVLMEKGLPWAAVRTQHQGNLGAVIEAAEARRAEIYGALDEVAA